MGFLEADFLGFKTPIIKFGDGDVGVELIKEEGENSKIDTLVLYQLSEALHIGKNTVSIKDKGAHIDKANKDREVLLIRFEKSESVDVIINSLKTIKANLISKNNNKK